MKDKEKEIIYFRESFVQSLMADVSSFAIMLGSFWFNYHYIGNNGFVDFFLIVVVFMTIAAKASKKMHRFTSREELLNFLQNKGDKN